MKFLLWVAIPAFLAFYFFSNAQSNFADVHHLYSTYCVAGWVASVVTASVLIYHFGKMYKKK